MVTLSRPGVYIDESSLPTYVSSTPGVATAAFVGPMARGPVVPKMVRSWNEFSQWYGGFDTTQPPSPMHMAVYGYFSAGGTSCVVIRAPRLTAPKDEPATIVLDDQATTPLATLTVTAANPGTWGGAPPNAPGQGLYVTIVNNKTGVNTGTFNIQVYYGSTTNLVESWPNLSMGTLSTTGQPTVPAPGQANYAPAIVNSPYSGSKYITLTDMASTTAAGTNNPADQSATPLAGGVGGAISGSSGPTQTDLQAAWQLLDLYPSQPFVINLPGDSTTSDISLLRQYVENRGDCFVVMDCPQGQTPSAMVSFVEGMTFTSAQVAIYYPWIQITDPYTPVPGATRLVPPGGFVVGQYINTDTKRGVQKAPAGLGTSISGATGLELIITNQDQGTLTQVNVNCLISVPGSGVVIWGARTLSPYLITRYVSVERTLIYLATQMVAMTQYAVFESNDWVLWNSITMILSQFLNAFWQSGGLSGSNATSAYFITCDGSNNTPQSIQQGIVNIDVGVALQFPAEFVVISIGQWAGGSNVSISTI